MQRSLYILLLLKLTLFPFITWAQDFYMQPNRGQWKGDFSYKVDMNNGAFFLSDEGFRFSLTDFMDRMHHNNHDQEDFDEYQVSNVFFHWIGAQNTIEKQEGAPSKHYNNYFLGNNPANWRSKVHALGRVRLNEVFSDVDVEFTTTSQGLKYNYIVHDPNAVNNVIFQWEGADKISIREQSIVIQTPLGEIVETIPESYVYVEGKKEKVKISYHHLGDDKFKFSMDPAIVEYDSLVIDPVLTFSTYSGSTADNWGTTACPDKNDNAIGGGITFGSGYPTTPGSFMTDYQGGTGNGQNGRPLDISISKFNDDGTSLIYATYIGGSSGNEIPCSMIVDQNNDLYIYGATGSGDFPVSNGAYQTTYGGGATTSQNGIHFTGSDIYVFKLSEDGTTMLASTYVGGSELDGLNIGATALAKNYGDQFRGEINFDGNGNPIVASSTRSSDFPTVNPFDNSLGGTQDGVFFKLNQDLTSLLFSTYVGGNDFDALYGVRVDQSGSIFTVGGTQSFDLPATSGALNSSHSGDQDGFVAKINGNNLDVITYLGTPSYDQAYFVDVDLDDNVYVFGQSDGGYTITSGKYNNAGGGQFIHKLGNDLQTSDWSTRIGGNNNGIQISPTAFLVSDCYEIYISGWGGQTNVQNNGVTTSTTSGFPVTTDAYQPTTNGSNFYVALYEPDMTGLDYATFIGGQTSSANHVDGGTSRFDKRGIIYHSVCASCGGGINNGFTSTPGVYSTTAQSSNCNMAVFKFDLSAITSSMATSGNDICFPNGVNFTNTSTPGYAFEWNFGDGTTTNTQNPSHTFPGPGIYDVYLAVFDTTSCEIPDTSWTQIVISDPNAIIEASPDTTVCPGSEITFSVNDIYNGTYTWQIDVGHFNTPNTVANPTATIDTSAQIIVNVSYACGSVVDTIEVGVYDYQFNSGPDSALCLGESTQLYVDEGIGWKWSPSSSLDDNTLQNPMATPTENTEYIVEITTTDHCLLYDTVLVEVDQDIPSAILPDTVKLCSGSATSIAASDAREYLWYPDYAINHVDTQTVVVDPPVDTTYFVDLTNACGFNVDSTYIDVIFPDITASEDTIICPQTSAHLFVTGAEHYSWTPTESLVGESTSHVIAAPTYTTDYIVKGIDEYGCVAYDTVQVALFPHPQIQVSPDYYGFVGDTVRLEAEGTPGVYQWKPAIYLSCEYCTNPIAMPPKNQTFVVSLTDTNGCKTSDQVTLYFDAMLYVPNAFTPNGDGHNQTFGVEGGNVNEFTLYVFNRWGELVFESHDINGRWDGTYDGKQSPMDVYVWKIIYTDVNNNKRELYGHVSLLR